MMNEEQAQDLLEKSLEMDPRKAACGIYTGGSFVLDSVRVFSWFASMEELERHLRDVQPLSYSMDEDDIAEYKLSVNPLLEKLAKQGLSESLMAEMNEAVSATYVIDWWGTFDELKSGETEFACQVRGWFRDDEQETGVIQEDEIEDFVDFLTTCGC